ncbi:MAG: polysaccharide deacetylase family protein [Agathobacter sp.]|uniref:polysaccharide deacetylase family protein n=1 Tax=Agathobacter sp. TaxID=2021311 RepID=UPI002589349D|nr:polysaccharide deacetylase family protein [Agathobacter sp.]MCR5676754.1 polysaccharide deacetylase family protein [Agathobacter sp.]
MKDDLNKLDIVDFSGDRRPQTRHGSKDYTTVRTRAYPKRRRRKKNHTGLLLLAAMTVVLVVAFIALLIFDKKTIKFSIKDGETTPIEYGEVFDPKSVTANYTGRIFGFSKKECIVTLIEGDTDFSALDLGEYHLKYRATYSDQTKECSQILKVQDTTGPEIKLEGEGYASPGTEYKEEGYTAVDNYDGDVTDKVKVDAFKDKITYSVTDSNGNTSTVERTITYKDVFAPEITLTDGEKVLIQLNSTYKEPGYKAVDDVDGDVTDKVKVEGTVDSSKYGTSYITYTVSDSNGNEAKVTRMVVVQESDPPTLTLKGDTSIYLNVGDTFEDPGYKAEDAVDGDLTEDVKIGGSVDTSKAGVYLLKYTVADHSDNEVTAERYVYVYQKQADDVTKDPGKKIVYLTFDDGPGPYTQQLLDILDKYNVKVTFFVTNQFPKYADLIGEEYKRGHTVALHSYSHDYPTIYKSKEAFFTDIAKMNEIIYEQTGQYANILRFPGGTSNTISRHYATGIMADLAESAPKLGYFYSDWNITSGDAGETTVTSEIVANVTAGMKYQDVSIVLQHDIKDFSVNAVEEIIQWGLANGYTFLPMDETTPMVHWKANN